MKIKNDNIDRREFLERAAKVAAATTTFGFFTPIPPSFAANGRKLKIAIVGTGNRGTVTWGERLVRQMPDYVELVALCDSNPKRVDVAQQYIGVEAAKYEARDFDLMIKETKPDTVIVTTPDCYHVHYACRAMKLGCDVVVEKALATTVDQCKMLINTERETGKSVITTFNARHGNSSEETKRFILSGEMGRIVSGEFHEYLDIYHGADYFRRWHGKSRFSGTLLVHKASHHFDQMNWWLQADPVEVHAFGKVDFYGSKNPFRAPNCRNCSKTNECDFYYDIMQNDLYVKLYVMCEDADGYLRDGCVWDKEIDTYDSMTVEVKYSNNVILSYTLNAFMPYEGQTIALNGTTGRLDIRNHSKQPWEVENPAEFRFTENFGKSRTWNVQRDTGEHGGADMKLKQLIFDPNQEDSLKKLAGSRAGVMSSLVGIAARISIETGKRVKIADLIDIPGITEG